MVSRANVVTATVKYCFWAVNCFWLSMDTCLNANKLRHMLNYSASTICLLKLELFIQFAHVAQAKSH